MTHRPSRRTFLLGMLAAGALTDNVVVAGATGQRWSQAMAAAWYARQPWLVGANYVPASAVNQLEMWQPETFDPERIDRELDWAQALGMNTMRVFLHDLLWQQDSEGFRQRVDRFLQIAARHDIRPMLVLFDSCWDPQPHLGPQPAPRPGVHNSGWVQSPSAKALANPAEYARLRSYVTGVVGAFATDSRILAWDVWNEPTNINDSIFPGAEAPGKADLVLALLPQVFGWARAAGASQPLTSALWIPEDDWSSERRMKPIERIQISQSDIVSFHNYQNPSEFQRHLRLLMRYRRQIILSEYLARSFGSTIEGILPIAKRYKVGAINWGLVAGKTQTYFPWDSWQSPYVDRPLKIWHHDLLRADGGPYSLKEANLIRDLARQN